MTTISINGLVLSAGVCLHCGARIYPAKSVPDHMSRHAKLDAECSTDAPWYGRTGKRSKGNTGWSTKRKVYEKKQI